MDDNYNKIKEAIDEVTNYYSRMNRVLDTKRPITHILSDDNFTMITTLRNLFNQYEKNNPNIIMPIFTWDPLRGLCTGDGAYINKKSNPLKIKFVKSSSDKITKIIHSMDAKNDDGPNAYLTDNGLDLLNTYEVLKQIWASGIKTLLSGTIENIISFEPVLIISNPSSGHQKPTKRELNIYNDILSFSTKANKYIANNVIADDKLLQSFGFNPHIIVIDSTLLDNDNYGVRNYSKYAEIVDFSIVPFKVIKSLLLFWRYKFDISSSKDDLNKDKTSVSSTIASYEIVQHNLQYPHGFTAYEEEDIESLAEGMAGFSILEIQQLINAAQQAGEKIQYEKLIEYRTKKYRHNPLIRFIEPVDIKQVGGMLGIKEYVKIIKSSFSVDFTKEFPEANLPTGMLLVGVGGTGKTFIGKAMASVLSLPMLHLQIGSLKGSRVGMSEERTKEAFDLIEAIGSCVVFIDEIEKEIGGVQSSNKTDGGVLNSMFSIILQRMQDIHNKKLKIFFCASSNGIEEIPTPLLRRFQNVFFVDLPTVEEKIKILDIHLSNNGINTKKINLEKLAIACENFTPNDISGSINEAIALFFYEKKNKLILKKTKFDTDYLYNFIKNRFYAVTTSRLEEVNTMRSLAETKGYRFANKSFFINRHNSNTIKGKKLGFKKTSTQGEDKIISTI